MTNIQIIKSERKSLKKLLEKLYLVISEEQEYKISTLSNDFCLSLKESCLKAEFLTENNCNSPYEKQLDEFCTELLTIMSQDSILLVDDHISIYNMGNIGQSSHWIVTIKFKTK